MSGGRTPSEPQTGRCKMCGDTKVLCRNLCWRHYRAARKSGELAKVTVVPRTCDCGKPAIAKGQCWAHYKRKRRQAIRRPPCHDGKRHRWTVTGRCLTCQREK